VRLDASGIGPCEKAEYLIHMLRNIKDMEDLTIAAMDGIVGRVRDFYFDDNAWVIRYLIVETHERLPRRRVLISPIAIGQPNWIERVLPVSITRKQVHDSPDIDTEKPVSRQQEMGYRATMAMAPTGEAVVFGEQVRIRTSCRRDCRTREPTPTATTIRICAVSTRS